MWTAARASRTWRRAKACRAADLARAGPELPAMIQSVAVCARRAWFAESLGVAAGCAAALAGWSSPAHAQGKGPTLELGLYGGAFLPDEQNHEFYDPARSEQEPIDPVAPELGLRVAFFPLGFL